MMARNQREHQSPEMLLSQRYRLSTAKEANELYDTYKNDDRERDIDRSVYEALFDGEAPYSQAEIDSLGQGYRTNLNFGDAEAMSEHAVSSYYDLTNSVERLVDCHTSYGDPVSRVEYSNIISEEFHRMLKEWDRFDTNHQLLSKWFVRQGVGLAVFPDSIDWRYSVLPIGNFYVPEMTKINESDLAHAVFEKDYKPDELYMFIEDEQAAKEGGWNAPLVKEAICKALRNKNQSTELETWEEIQRRVKNHSLSNYSKENEIRCSYHIVREYDGQYSLSITLRENDSEFLYRCPQRFKRPTQLFVYFLFDIGNGTLHSVRGLGKKIYNRICTINRLQCQMVDGAFFGASVMLQPEKPSDVQNLGIIYTGPLAYLPPGVKIAENRISNVSENTLPIVRELTNGLNSNTGQYRTNKQPAQNRDVTAFERRTDLAKESALNNTTVNLFYQNLEKLLKEVMIRVKNPDYSANDPGGKEVFELRKRLAERGVPSEALESVYKVVPVRSLGNGAPEVRNLVAEQIMRNAGAFDEQGRHAALRDWVASWVGYDMADRYVPSSNTLRKTSDTKIAQFENALMRLGQPVEPQIGENSSEHVKIHVPEVINAWNMFKQGQADPTIVYKQLVLLIPHTRYHLQLLSTDASAGELAKSSNKALQQVESQFPELENFIAQRQESSLKASQGQTPDLDEQIKAQRAQAELATADQKHFQEMTHKQQRHEQDLAIKDATQAATLRKDNHGK